MHMSAEVIGPVLESLLRSFMPCSAGLLLAFCIELNEPRGGQRLKMETDRAALVSPEKRHVSLSILYLKAIISWDS